MGDTERHHRRASDESSLGAAGNGASMDVLGSLSAPNSTRESAVISSSLSLPNCASLAGLITGQVHTDGSSTPSSPLSYSHSLRCRPVNPSVPCNGSSVPPSEGSSLPLPSVVINGSNGTETSIATTSNVISQASQQIKSFSETKQTSPDRADGNSITYSASIDTMQVHEHSRPSSSPMTSPLSMAYSSCTDGTMQVPEQGRPSSSSTPSSSSSILRDSFSSSTTFDPHCDDSSSIVFGSTSSIVFSSTSMDNSFSQPSWFHIPGREKDSLLPKIINSQGKCARWDEDSSDSTDIQDPELTTMKERFAKLLLGEDLSGGAKGVSTALAISNAITNLSASVFGELWKLVPLSEGRKERWQREMGRLLTVSDYIVEYVPSSQSYPDGTTMKIMVTKPRTDLDINLPALRQLDAMLIDALDSFKRTEFWYTDQALLRAQKGGSLLREKEKWWLPVPQIPSDGLSVDARRHLEQQKACMNQILKAALAVNAQVLSEMEVPAIYWDSLPKNGRSSLGDTLYRVIASEEFSPHAFVSSMDSSQEHTVVDSLNRVEAAIHVWRRKLHTRQTQVSCKDVQTPWRSGKDGLHGLARRELLIERAESLLLLLRHRFPGLPQSTLDMHKIQYNKDVGQSILESYSRVLESLAFNIKSRINDVIHADDVKKGDWPSDSASSCSRTRGNVPSSVVQLASGRMYGAQVNPLHALSQPNTPSASPAHFLQTHNFGSRSVKVGKMEITDLGEHFSKGIPWLGSYKHLSYSSSKINILQRSLSRH